MRLGQLAVIAWVTARVLRVPESASHSKYEVAGRQTFSTWVYGQATL